MIWNQVTPSEFEHERDALAFLHDHFPMLEPNRVWTNFTFIDSNGSLNEVDALVLTQRGFFLMEIKSYPGQIRGDMSTWVWTHDGRNHLRDNPLLLCDRKAKKLVSLLKNTRAFEKRKIPVPFLDPIIFLSDPHVDVEMSEPLQPYVHRRDGDRPNSNPEHQGIIWALTHGLSTAIRQNRPTRNDRRTAQALDEAMQAIGIHPVRRARKIGHFDLLELLDDGPLFQDWLGQHEKMGYKRRIRIYGTQNLASDLRKMVQSAAKREVRVHEAMRGHTSILHFLDYQADERGEVLVFDQPEDYQRLDLYLKEPEKPGLDTKLHIIRLLTESLKYAHEQKVVHRTLCPRNILVINPKKQFPKIRILNWATARNDGQSSSLTLHVTTHLDQFVDAEQAAYLAPESLRAVDQDAELLDVFALGALAYHLFSGIPPAESADHLVEKLTTGGLRLSAVLDGVTRALDDLIESATLPDVSHRLASVRAFAEGLDGVEEELTAPAPKEPEFDPAAIPVGSMLNNQFKVLNRLGQGATAIAFLVESDGIRKVLKLADHPNHNDDLLAEHRVLEKLNHKRVVSLLPPNLVEIHGHVGLLLRPADLGTLGDRLRRGRIQLELLQRFGEDLLEALHYLETMGLPHRDIKPDNIGEVEEGKNDERHLMLFDFSLANKPYEDIRSGTPAYRDPFLVKRKRWDPHADRFSAALTLYEMATGHLPRWGDGRSEPALIAEEVHIESELFEPVTRLALTQFFAKALARETAKRFDTAAQMNMAWRQAFQRITQSGSGLTPHGPSGLDLEHLHLESSITELNLSALELQALESADLTCIADLLEREPLYFLKLRGAARDTRHQLHKLALKLQKHFQKVRKSEPNNGLPAVDQLFGWLYPREAAQTRILRAFFEGILPDETALETITPHAVAHALGLTVIDVFRVLGLFRARIQKRFSRPFSQLMEIMKTTLLREGGIISLPVLAERVLRVLGSSAAESERKTMAWAVTRAGLVYGEDTRKQVFWRTQIVGERVAITWDADGHAQARIHALTNLVQELDDLADQLPPLETIHSLLHNQQQNWDDPTEMRVLDPLSRLRVALQFTARARLSSRNEIYPKGLPAARALSLGRNALIGLSKVSIQDLRTRIQNRYLEAEPLPDRPELDGLLQASGSSLVWDPHKGAYTYPQADQMGATFLGTQHTSQRFQSKAQGDQLKHEYQRLEERLQYSAQNGGLLFLMVAPHAYRSAAQHLQSRFNPQLLNADLWLIQSLKAEAQQRKVDWRVVREADAKPGSSDWQKLNRLVQLSQARWSNLPDSGASPLLMTHPGLLARYDLMETFSLWREQCRKRALWVLVAGYAQVDGPILDGKPLPILTANEWARVPQSWAEQVG